MAESCINVLIINEDPVESRWLNGMLSIGDKHRFSLQCAETLATGMSLLSTEVPEVVLLSLRDDELEKLDKIRALSRDVPVVVVTDSDSSQVGREACEHGAQDHLSNGDMNADILSRSLQFAVERQRLQQELEYANSRDSLTGLANRASFIDHLDDAIARAQHDQTYTFAVIFLDIEHFKKVNDRQGHDLGDQLLVEFGRRLQKCACDLDIVSRFGADEFAILLDGVENSQQAVEYVQRIQQQLQMPVALNGEDVVCTPSIGVALSETGYRCAGDLMCDADTAMRRAKELGSSRHQVFDSAMRQRTLAKIQLETDLRGALKRQEFQLHYQPIVRLESGRLSGFEALLRWQHPQRGFVSPQEMIEVAEESGLIVPIGRWVLREACRQMHEWHHIFPSDQPLTISVNLSSLELNQPDLIQQIDRILDETNLDPRCLDLEITETAVIENDAIANAVFRQMRDRGIRLSVDDFGMGYSSLSYLHRFSFDTLKIDRSFVARLGDDLENSDIFVQTIVSLAKNLGLDVVAEGVETSEQLSRLKHQHCEYGQGYLFSKPLDCRAACLLLANESASEQPEMDRSTEYAALVGSAQTSSNSPRNFSS